MSILFYFPFPFFPSFLLKKVFIDSGSDLPLADASDQQNSETQAAQALTMSLMLMSQASVVVDWPRGPHG